MWGMVVLAACGAAGTGSPERFALARHRVGDCRPYEMPAMAAGGTLTIRGTACLQPDGTGRILPGAH